MIWARSCFSCIPAYGHTNPTLGVVRELTARGHQVWYYSYNFMREKIEAAGAVFVSCDDNDMEQKLMPKDAARLGKDMAFSMQIIPLRSFSPARIPFRISMCLWGRRSVRRPVKSERFGRSLYIFRWERSTMICCLCTSGVSPRLPEQSIR